jgi:hypothetical protein
LTDNKNKRYELLSKIQSNSLRAMALVVARGGGDDSTYFDCVIGNRLTALAMQKYAEAPSEVIEYIHSQALGEQCHCKIFPAENSEIAERIAQFHTRIIESNSWPSFLSCMPLLGERMALATAFCLKNTGLQDRNSHTTDKGFLDEYYHTSQPLNLLALYATEEELEQALRSQEKFLDLMHVPIDIYDATDPGAERCTLQGRQSHEIRIKQKI